MPDFNFWKAILHIGDNQHETKHSASREKVQKEQILEFEPFVSDFVLVKRIFPAITHTNSLRKRGVVIHIWPAITANLNTNYEMISHFMMKRNGFLATPCFHPRVALGECWRGGFDRAQKWKITFVNRVWQTECKGHNVSFL